MASRLSDAERSRLCIEYAAHARKIWASLDQLADSLAEGDVDLRAELRLIEEFLR
ncbi:hypothetical protein [Rathayibacter sp. SD072]|uniref:hypothetical protein n=1 Tax=Rathayibacter sp. SD072 TaxID=2781731 RepID=UPI001A973BDC|nr:hypothetical protein [Rathayibacter sp. SD072]MBO0983659.1 hypothetical protein [Rathayibacter sp. SD072]